MQVRESSRHAAPAGPVPPLQVEPTPATPGGTRCQERPRDEYDCYGNALPALPAVPLPRPQPAPSEVVS